MTAKKNFEPLKKKSKTTPGRKKTVPTPKPAPPPEPEPEPDYDPETDPEFDDQPGSDYIQTDIPTDEMLVSDRIDDIVSFIEGIEGINEAAVRMHVYRYDTQKPVLQQTRDDRVKKGTLEFNPSSWEDDIHACFPEGGRFYIEWRWVYNIFGPDGNRLRKAGSVEAGIHRRFDPLPVQVTGNTQQGIPSGVPVQPSPYGAPLNREEIERQARNEIKQNMEWQMTMMGNMMNFVQGIPKNGQNGNPGPPPADPLIDKIKESVINAGLESLQGPAVSAVRERPLAITDVISNIGVALVNKLDPSTVNMFLQNMVKPPDTAPAQNQVIESPPIEPGATEADIVRYPLPSTASPNERYTRVLKIIYEDLTTNAPVTDSATALKELVEAVPDYKQVITQNLLPLPVEKLKEQLLTGYSEQGQTAIKNTATADAWLENLKKAMS